MEMPRPTGSALAVWLLVLAACAGDTSVTTSASPDPGSTAPSGGTVIEPTTEASAASTTSKPAPTTTTTGSSLVSFGDIVGAYEVDPAGFGFLQISEDGTLLWAGDRNDPDQIELEARIEGSTVVITDPDCGQDEGIYEFRLFDTGGFELVLIEDACPGRAGLIPGTYLPVN